MSDRSLELAGGALPAPSSIAAQLRRQLNDAVAAERTRRGEVRLPEDIWPMARALARVVETCGEYERAFKKAAHEANLVAEEDLIDAVGEQAGVPNQGMTVPDADGDVKVDRWMVNTYDFDQAALLNAVAFAVRDEYDVTGTLSKIYATFGVGVHKPTTEEAVSLNGQVDEFVSHLLLAAMRCLIELGKFEPQVSKVRKFTTNLARLGGFDEVVSTVTSGTRKRTEYKGVKVSREVPK